MNIIRRTIGAVALAAVAAVGYGDDAVVADGAEIAVEGTGASAQCTLDLSEGWTVSDFDPMNVPYSAVGWGIEEDGKSGWAVTLELTPVAGGSASVVASGLTGRGTNVWDTGGVRNDAYVLRHFVRKNDADEPIETLEAYLVFDRSAVRPLETLVAVAEAAFPDAGRSCAATAMGGANWTAVDFAGDGIAGPATGTATVTFASDGIGLFAFEYKCAAGETLAVAVDGGDPQALATASDWTAARFAFGDIREHTVVISATGGGTAVRGVRWDDGESSVGAVTQCALDLTDVWDKRNVNAEPILWSSLGWEDVAEEESGKTVTLQLVPLSAGEAQTLMEAQAGYKQTYTWAPGEVTKQIYAIRHVVSNGSPLETDLNAYFSFENYDHVAPSEADVRAAIKSDDGTGGSFGIVNDAVNWWNLVGGPGEGIEASQGESALTFTVDGHGTFFFDYALGGGAWTVSVDGVLVKSLAEAADWTVFGLSCEGLRAHTIVFSTDLPSEWDFAALRNVRWVEQDWCSRAGKGSGTAVDLQTNDVLVVQRNEELMPFAWSSTNFTGNALVKDTGFISINPQSVASVIVVQVTGEGDDVSQWTTEVGGTAKTLVAENQGEGTVKWKGAKPGVWKAVLVIKTDGNEVYRETRILDLRKYVGKGMMIFVI